LILAQAGFTYNNYVNRSTKKTPFEIVIWMNPKGNAKLRELNAKIKRSFEAKEFLDFMKNLHEEVKRNLKDVIWNINKQKIKGRDINILTVEMRL